jgi:signal transduction histidine kinase
MLILMSLSLMFSIAMYQVASFEVETRLNQFQNSLSQTSNLLPHQMLGLEFRNVQIEEARENLSVELLYVNLLVFIVGGFGSYYLARRSLLPIEKAHEAQSRFTSDASHELRTPLAVMKMEIEMALRDKNATLTDLREILTSNLEEVNKLNKLAQMLLDLSNLDHKKLEISTVNLGKLANNLVKEFKQPTSRIQIKPGKGVIINANETAISELIRILINNALQYSPKDSLIYIDVLKTDTQAKFEITNTGPGITEDKLPHIFDRFYRADSSRTDDGQKGYGLGLALAKSIIELHNGEIIASSTPNHATTFTFLVELRSKPKQNTRN